MNLRHVRREERTQRPKLTRRHRSFRRAPFLLNPRPQVGAGARVASEIRADHRSVHSGYVDHLDHSHLIAQTVLVARLQLRVHLPQHSPSVAHDHRSVPDAVFVFAACVRHHPGHSNVSSVAVRCHAARKLQRFLLPLRSPHRYQPARQHFCDGRSCRALAQTAARDGS